MTAHWTENTRALKILIIVMTSLIFLGLIALVYGVARTAGQMTEKQEKQDRATAARTDAAGIVHATLPAGAVIVSTAIADRRALIHLRIEGEDYLLTLDTKTGARKGFIRLVRE